MANETKPIWIRNPKEIKKDQYNEFYKNAFNEFVDPLANNQEQAKDNPKTYLSFDNSRDLCYERALMVCGRYKGDFPNTLKLRGIRADMTNSTIDIDVQQANDIPLIKVPFCIKSVYNIFLTAADGNTFPEYRDNIQGYVTAATGNYNQGNSGYRPPGVANQTRPPGFVH
ncbi:reverse transcriptase domain-containing protein [Tanacetum coccineum]